MKDLELQLKILSTVESINNDLRVIKHRFGELGNTDKITRKEATIITGKSKSTIVKIIKANPDILVPNEKSHRRIIKKRLEELLLIN